MFANLLPQRPRPHPGAIDRAFVREVRIPRRSGRNRASEALLAAGWLLILGKCAGTFWVVQRYAMPINAWWIVAPSLAAAAACTWIYLRRD